MNYALQENLHGSLGVLAGWDDVGNHQDQTFEQVRARVRYNYTEKVNFDVSAGGELREYQNGHSAALDPVFSLAGKYLPSERTTVALIGYRQQVASIYNGYYYADTGANLSLQQEIVYICTLDISMGYHVLNYTPINNQTSQYTDSFYDAKVGVEFHIIKHLSGQMFYQMIQRTSAVNGNVTENQVELSLTCRY
jgi:cell division protein FtsI/penicillin-binding protein 2